MQKVMMYRAADGRLFDNLHSAAEHDLRRKLHMLIAPVLKNVKATDRLADGLIRDHKLFDALMIAMGEFHQAKKEIER